MNNNLLKEIQRYLNTSIVDYAVMIAGEWGIGKTHFIKKTLLPFLENEGKKPIYVSLYGLQSIAELRNQLIVEKLPAIVNKAKQWTSILSRTTAGIWGRGEEEKSIREALSYGGLMLLKNEVIILDDIERTKVDLTELLGFCNGILEQGKNRLVIVGNSDELKADTGSNLEMIKEKVIRFAFAYSPDVKGTITAVIDTLNLEKDYEQFLKLHADLICGITEFAECLNFRVLSKCLMNYEKVFKLMKDRPRIVNSIGVVILKLLIALEMDLRKDRMTIAHFKSVLADEERFYSVILQNGDEEKRNELQQQDKEVKGFFKRYYPTEHELYGTRFLGSIITFVETGLLNSEAFSTEIQNIFEREEEISEHLTLEHYWKLSDDEFVTLLDSTMKFLRDTGFRRLSNYFRIFGVLSRLVGEELLKMPLLDLSKTLLSRIEGDYKVANLEYEPTLRDVTRTIRYPAGSVSEAFVESLHDYNSKMKSDMITARTKDLLQLLVDDVSRFCDIITNDTELRNYPIFSIWSTEDLFVLILKLSNNDKVEFLDSLSKRFSGHWLSDFKEDIPGLKKLAERLHDHVKGRNMTVGISILRSLATNLDEATKKIEEA